jgi:two-component system cell cycle response regulator
VSYVSSRFEQLKATGALPSPDGVALEILRLSQSEDTTIAQFAHVLKADPALASRLVKFANSTCGGGVRPVVSIRDAVRVLGFAVVRQLCLGFSVLNANRSGGCAGFDYARYWSRSLATALSAQSLCLRVRVLAPEESFTCGLLADIGSLAIASLYPERFSEVLASGVAGPDRSVVEREAFGADHLEFGAALLEDWRLPKICVDAVFHSELPERAGFEPSSRPQVLCELLSLARRVGEYFVADAQARERGAPPMLLNAARIGIDADTLMQICDAVAEEWQRWGSVLGVATGTPPKLDLCALAASIGIADEAAVGATDEATVAGVPATDAGDMAPAALEGGIDIDARPGMLAALRIHVVSDSRSGAGHLLDMLARSGHAVTPFAAADAALAAALADPPDLMLIDLPPDRPDTRALYAGLRATAIGSRVYVIGIRRAPADATRVAMADPAPGRDPIAGMHSGMGGDTDTDAEFDDYLGTPVDGPTLELRLRVARRVLALRRALRHAQDAQHRLAADLALANRRLQRCALTDSLSGLPNRRYAFNRLAQAWDDSTRLQQPLSCMVIDIDHVRRLNEAAGYRGGDRAIGAVATILRESVRASDRLCQVGGQEFLVICPDTDGPAATAAADHLREVIAKRAGPAAGTARATVPALTLSIGVATRDPSIPNVESLVQRAEDALKSAKLAGRNRVQPAATLMDAG